MDRNTNSDETLESVGGFHFLFKLDRLYVNQFVMVLAFMVIVTLTLVVNGVEGVQKLTTSIPRPTLSTLLGIATGVAAHVGFGVEMEDIVLVV